MTSGGIDQIKQRIKKVATGLAGDDNLTSQGKLDQAVQQLKGKLQQAVDQMRAAVAAKRASRLAK